MNFYNYIGVGKEEFSAYVADKRIDMAQHETFPLMLLTYGRKTVSEQLWDNVTQKCRGIIVNVHTDEIVARPFEKFFNLETTMIVDDMKEPTVVQEKMDGFLCTMYEWAGNQYVASKGSFHSPHAKWATATYLKTLGKEAIWPDGYTPVFEGITRNLRIVVDYEQREELVLLALINKETGEELPAAVVKDYATVNGFSVPKVYSLRTREANDLSFTDRKNFEGYVLRWDKKGEPPHRLKVKFLTYTKLHRMVCGVSPKAIYKQLSGEDGWTSDLNTWLDESVPWFSAFVKKWVTALQTEYDRIAGGAHNVFEKLEQTSREDVQRWSRKDWAIAIKKYPEEMHSILFAMLDNKNPAPFIWKRTKYLLHGSHPMIDAAKL